jgi:beta-lactamase class A
MFKLTALILAAACTASAMQTPTLSPSSSGQLTTSPVEFTNLTVYNDGETHVIDKSTSLDHESYVVSQETTIQLKEVGSLPLPIANILLFVSQSAQP